MTASRSPIEKEYNINIPIPNIRDSGPVSGTAEAGTAWEGSGLKDGEVYGVGGFRLRGWGGYGVGWTAQ